MSKLRPGIVGMRGSKVIRTRPCMTMSTPHHPSRQAHRGHVKPTGATLIARDGAAALAIRRTQWVMRLIPATRTKQKRTVGGGARRVKTTYFKPCAPRTDELYDLYDLFPLEFILYIFQGRRIPDLYDLNDLYDLAHDAAWELYNLHDLGTGFLDRICTTQIMHRISSRQANN